MKNTLLLLASLFIGIALSNAQTKKKSSKQKLEIFTYNSEMCSGNKGYYNPQKYSREEIEGAYLLFPGFENFSFFGPMVFSLNALEDVRKNQKKYISDLENDYRESLNRFQKITIVPNTPYWQKLQKATGENIRGKYEFELFRIQVYNDPDLLKQRTAPAACQKYADAITTKDEKKKLAVWKELAIEQSRNNADPQRILNEFEARSQSPYKEDYAFLNLFGFGYCNCINRANNNVETEINDSNYDAFDKLFEKIEPGDCDEP